LNKNPKNEPENIFSKDQFLLDKLVNNNYIILQVKRKSSKKISSVRQRIYSLQKERSNLIWELLNSLPVAMIPASLTYVYKTCSTPNCKCQKGEKHGPYPAISIKVNNKYRLKMVRKKDITEVEKKTRAYKKYQNGLSKINKLNKEIYKLLQEARDENLEEYK